MLEVTGIEKHFKRKQILKGASFTAAAGTCVGIVGSNGCGKTTLLSIVAGAVRPDRGSVTFDGQEAVGRPRVFEKFAAYVPQENPLMPELSAWDNLLLWYKGDKRRLTRDLEEGTAHVMRVGDFLKTPAGKLSGGQKKRLSIAGALANHAPVLVMDEPGAALDLACKEEIREYLLEYMKKGGCVVLTSHEMAELSVCHRMYVLRKGILQEIPPAQSPGELISCFTNTGGD